MNHPGPNHIQRLINEYLKSKEFADKANERVDELKTALRAYVKDNGTSDEKGHIWLPAETHKLKNERRVSVSFDSNKAEVWAKENGHWDKIKKTVEMVDEDLLMTLIWQDETSDAVLGVSADDFYNARETWAFKVVEGKNYDDE